MTPKRNRAVRAVQGPATRSKPARGTKTAPPTRKPHRSPPGRKQTSDRVSRIAAKVLRGCRDEPGIKPIGTCAIGALLDDGDPRAESASGWYRLGFGKHNVTVAELRSLAASCLGQDETKGPRR